MAMFLLPIDNSCLPLQERTVLSYTRLVILVGLRLNDGLVLCIRSITSDTECTFVGLHHRRSWF